MRGRPTAVIVLAAGKGTRMRSVGPKVLHRLAGRPMIRHLLDTVAELGPERTVCVLAPGMDAVAAAAAGTEVAVQAEQRGTADAVLAARAALAGFDGDVLILFADTPLVGAGTMRAALDALRSDPANAVCVLGMRPAGPNRYGRLVTDGAGGLTAIVEWEEADAATRAIPLCNSGVMAADGRLLFGLLDRVAADNAKGERYLTDIVALARAAGRSAVMVEGAERELLGVNSRAELARAEAVVQEGLRERAFGAGVTMLMPETVYLSHDTVFGRDVTIGPNSVFLPGVRVGSDVEIRGFCHFEGATIRDGAVVGPFARLRPGTDIGPGAHIGNFVEVKNAVVEEGAKANHLTYLGDARVGAGANVGAGTITCNYDGFRKHRTEIGHGAFIGSNTALVAPVRVGAGAFVGAGSTVSRDVPADALVVERAPAREREGWAARFRARIRSGDGG